MAQDVPSSQNIPLDLEVLANKGRGGVQFRGVWLRPSEPESSEVEIWGSRVWEQKTWGGWDFRRGCILGSWDV